MKKSKCTTVIPPPCTDNVRSLFSWFYPNQVSELLKPGVGQSANPLAIEADESSATVEQRRVMMKYYNILPTTSEFSQKFEKVMEPSEV